MAKGFDELIPTSLGDAFKFLKEAKSMSASNNAEQVGKLLGALYIVVQRLLGEDDDGPITASVRKNKVVLAKVQFAYVYYYARWLELQTFGPKPDRHGRVKKPESTISKLYEAGEANDCKFTKMFSYILDENQANSSKYVFVKGHANTAAHFLDSIYDLKSNMFNLNDGGTVEAAMTLDDFFKDHKGTLNINDKEGRELCDSIFRNAKEDPLSALAAYLLRKTGEDEFVDAIMPKFDEDGKETADKLYAMALAKERIYAQSFKADYDKARNDGAEAVANAIGAFITNRATQKAKDAKASKEGDGKEKGGKKQEGPVKYEDELAMNMADYITGRIDAKEFARRDRQIRDRQPLKKNDNEELEQLDEVDGDSEE